MARKRAKVSTAIVPLDDISPPDIKEMHRLFSKYFDNTDFLTFTKDLKAKDGAIISREKATGTIVGFGTFKASEYTYKGKRFRVLFAGDNIMEKEYWGIPLMHFASAKLCLKEKLKHPLVPLYFFLITKGYKTYLTLANNYDRYYPRYDSAPQDDAYLKGLVETCCQEMYPKNYNPDTGLLDFGGGYQKLKENIAEIDEEMKRKYPKIAFFEKMNPTWQNGTELACIGEISLYVIITRGAKFALRMFKKR